MNTHMAVSRMLSAVDACDRQFLFGCSSKLKILSTRLYEGLYVYII